MDALRITGGIPLRGTIPISGAKNAALPLMAAALLTTDPVHFTNMPRLADIDTMRALLAELGCMATWDDTTFTLHTQQQTQHTAPYELVRKMRASILVLGALLAARGEAKVSLPGGCAIGTRPVDLHLKGMEALGATVRLEQGYIHATVPHGLKGAAIALPFASVGATENILMAACLANGETTITNAAREPEIVDLAACLTAMGAHIEGAGTGIIRIQGKSTLHGAHHPVLPDRIEAGTYAIAAAITRGDVCLTHANPDALGVFWHKLREAGIEVVAHDMSVTIRAHNGWQGTDAMTEPFPGFPTDLQAQFMALMTLAEGASMITETIFENRFMHVPELCRMGAHITVQHSSALVRGVKTLLAAPVMATDLRASSGLILAALAAEGTSQIARVYHLDRGYERLEEKLSACGAQIERFKETP